MSGLTRSKHGVQKIKQRYDLTEEQFFTLLLTQNNKCAICGVEKGDKWFCVDHDHTTGKVRGLLCGNCNTGIGMLQDNIHIVRKAVKYLYKTQKGITMPLKPGKANIGSNIKTEVGAGKPFKQAKAIALNKALGPSRPKKSTRKPQGR